MQTQSPIYLLHRRQFLKASTDVDVIRTRHPDQLQRVFLPLIVQFGSSGARAQSAIFPNVCAPCHQLCTASSFLHRTAFRALFFASLINLRVSSLERRKSNPLRIWSARVSKCGEARNSADLLCPVECRLLWVWLVDGAGGLRKFRPLFR